MINWLCLPKELESGLTGHSFWYSSLLRAWKYPASVEFGKVVSSYNKKRLITILERTRVSHSKDNVYKNIITSKYFRAIADYLLILDIMQAVDFAEITQCQGSLYLQIFFLAFQPTRHRNITYWSYFSVGYYWNAELPKQFHCNMCEKSFASYQSLTNHTAVHEGKTTCQQCGKVESTRSNLARHIKSCHSLGQLWLIPMYFWCNINLSSMA